ncbi:uncharacterized protein TrAFT101_012065 [Trichoderma asperellum]|uniref:uncharacterized protein n=1 Tax=Trichoderma asperellum TaxID=101201 RepID=UPI003319AF90|nr:hypothetical protein TrAFT101_012065 [Trichoderma asperellum]
MSCKSAKNVVIINLYTCTYITKGSLLTTRTTTKTPRYPRLSSHRSRIMKLKLKLSKQCNHDIHETIFAIQVALIQPHKTSRSPPRRDATTRAKTDYEPLPSDWHGWLFWNNHPSFPRNPTGAIAEGGGGFSADSGI